MTAPLSADLRRRLIRAVEAGSSAREAARRFEVSPSATIKLMRRVRETGSAAPAKIGGYRKPLLAGHEALLRDLTAAKPGITLAEIQAELTGRGIEAGSLATIWTTLRRLGLRHKKTRLAKLAGMLGARVRRDILLDRGESGCAGFGRDASAQGAGGGRAIVLG
ncbi:transposase [Siccirubricoccus deserti]|uniref:Transposase n=1 Tax=Siccirubricoccus deserti TaxID=2013562 RepID=A0A9X0UKD9_9PROT|nr:transposase [Siccirubricoccus deserti]